MLLHCMSQGLLGTWGLNLVVFGGLEFTVLISSCLLSTEVSREVMA